ncbi:MAG TPA: GNAT family N-acetyltransferase [Mesorhizobium sp.]|jgi:ribosomal protein S18 acetylase RimI-like enzyme|nr:GNAT family N-acetyltransferase [Mesorhizobium sp.]
MRDIEIKPLEAAHRAAWERLYAGYAEFYRVAQTPAMRETVWGWIQSPGHEVSGLGALRNGELIGFAHFRPFARPLSASMGGFLDDLFVDPAHRGSGAADALIGAVAEEGRRRGWTVIRWITAADNTRARKLYDRVASRTEWVTYDVKL